MTGLAHVALALLALPAVAICLYLLLLTLLSARPRLPLPSARELRFDVIVPAHDEAAIIRRVVASLQRIDWPADRMRLLVVADNCTDATAELARAAGAEVLERSHATLRGKGHALAYAFDHSARRGWADAVVVVDADSEVSPNLLAALAVRIEQGAGALQVHYGVLNAQDSWRTRLMAIALGAFHRVRSRGRERLGLSCGLRGNGWCLTHAALARVPYRAFTLAEDIEYGIDLALAGERVHYADEAWVDALMVTGNRAAGTQRRRWEDGRQQLKRSKSLPLLRGARGRRGRVCLDLLLDLWVPPLSAIVLHVALLTGIAGVAAAIEPALAVWLAPAAFCLAALALYVLRGWQLSGVGRRGFVDLLRAPVFVVWKLVLMLRPHDAAKWVRTEREQP